MFKIIRNEFKEIKWLKTKDILRQTVFSFIVIISATIICMAFETSVQMLISMLIK